MSIRRISEVIADLEAHRRKYGDTYIYAENRADGGFFQFRPVQPQSLTQHHAVVELSPVYPATPSYRDFVDTINKHTRQPLWRRLFFGPPDRAPWKVPAE